jgi:acyl-CoA reductase-like NAD-dependent aldehyde dehydrogenase
MFAMARKHRRVLGEDSTPVKHATSAGAGGYHDRAVTLQSVNPRSGEPIRDDPEASSEEVEEAPSGPHAGGFPRDVFRALLIGSPRVGALIKFPQTVLEPGGSDPYVILEDADLDLAAGAFAFGGVTQPDHSRELGIPELVNAKTVYVA